MFLSIYLLFFGQSLFETVTFLVPCPRLYLCRGD
jgi:hypothetical protein